MENNFSLFFMFAGDCKQAMTFYATVFCSEIQDLMTYGEMPPAPGQPVAGADRDRVAYGSVPIFGCQVMFCDVPSADDVVIGTNISPTLGSENGAEIRRIFDALAEGGSVDMPLQKTFWSPQYGMVTDRYGISWQLTQTGDA